jgi:transcriptional regulator with XRE-family HTH domain
VRETTAYSREVADNVRVIMTRLRMSQVTLARITDIKPGRLHRRLKGESPFLDFEIASIAKALGVSADSLLPPVGPESESAA